MTQPSIWDDPEMQVSGDFVEFSQPGDSVTGTVQFVRSYRFTDGTVAPQVFLTLDDGQQKTLTAGAVRLKAALVEQRPESGDRLTVTLTSEEPRGGGKTLRHWDVGVQRGTAGAPAPAPAQQQVQAPAPQQPMQQQAQAPAPPQAPAQQPVDPQAAAAALANLTPEQRQALGLP